MADAHALAAKKCVPCKGGTPPLAGAELEALHAQLGGPESGWEVVDEHHLTREYRLANFADALALTNRIGALAEEEFHHPDLLLKWGSVRVTIWTHKIDGLTESDFVFAAKSDQLAS